MDSNKNDPLKKNRNKTKQKEQRDAMLPGPSNTSINFKKKKILKQNMILKDSSPLILKSPGTLCRLSMNIINAQLQPLSTNLNQYVHCLKNLTKDCQMNTPFFKDTPDCLQVTLNDIPKPKSCKKFQSEKKKQKIIITSNVVIKEADPEKRIVLQDIAQINKRKNKQAISSKMQPSKIKRRNKPIYMSESESPSETSFRAADTDDSDYETFDNYIESCLHEQEEQENICPFGLSDIDYCVEDYPEFLEGNWIIVKFASKKSIKHFVGKILSINDKIPTVKFTRRVKNSKRDKGTVFTYPNIEDIFDVRDLNDVVAVLPDPQISRRGHFIFNLDLNKYNIQ